MHATAYHWQYDLVDDAHCDASRCEPTLRLRDSRQFSATDIDHFRSPLVEDSREISDPHLPPVAVFTTWNTVPVELDNRTHAQLPAFLEMHLERLVRNARQLELTLPVNAAVRLEACVHQSLREMSSHISPEQRGLARMRVVLSQGRIDVFSEETIGPKDSKAPHLLRAICLDDTRRYPGIKCLPCDEHINAASRAQSLGADEALFCDSDGQLSEGAWSNLLWLGSDMQFYTPAAPALAGITLRVVSTLREVTAIPTTLSDLYQARAVLMLQSTRGIAQFSEIDTTRIEADPTARAILVSLNEDFRTAARSSAQQLAQQLFPEEPPCAIQL